MADYSVIRKCLALLLTVTLLLLTLGACGAPDTQIAPPTAVPTAPTPTEQLPETEPPTEPATVPETEPEPTEPYIVATASVGVVGDILAHDDVIKSGKTDTGYDFNEIYAYVKPYFESYNLMVANLEVTLGGEAAGAYRGYPCFNCPDDMVDALKNGGVDMLLTANNHSYDTGYKGMLRTLQVLQEKEMPNLGTRASTDEPLYAVKDINGIQVGMVCYTYETVTSKPGRKALNGILLSEEAGPLVSSFNYDKLDAFYADVEQTLALMKEQGAEATMVYIHWGQEYVNTPNSYQKKIAQKLSDLGVDVIVGNHAHVVQSYETLTGESGNKTYCIYSTGNAVSNMRREMGKRAPKGHTEDGILFGVEFAKWSDGRVAVSDINILPLWLDRLYVDGKLVFRIVPLDYQFAEGWESFPVSVPSRLAESYNRTMAIVGEALNASREDLGQDVVPVFAE